MLTPNRFWSISYKEDGAVAVLRLGESQVELTLEELEQLLSTGFLISHDLRWIHATWLHAVVDVVGPVVPGHLVHKEVQREEDQDPQSRTLCGLLPPASVRGWTFLPLMDKPYRPDTCDVCLEVWQALEAEGEKEHG